jgi:hypothetical protein
MLDSFFQRHDVFVQCMSIAIDADKTAGAPRNSVACITFDSLLSEHADGEQRRSAAATAARRSKNLQSRRQPGEYPGWSLCKRLVRS